MIIVAVIIAVVVFVIFLQDAERRIPVQYSKKIQGRKQVGGQSSHIPLKVNTGGVTQSSLQQSLMQTPCHHCFTVRQRQWFRSRKQDLKRFITV